MSLKNIINEAVFHAINEITDRNEDFQLWKQKFDTYLNDMVEELSDDILNKMGLKIQINPNYNFGKKKWLAVYQESQNKISNGIILIAINYPHFFNEMSKRGIQNDNFNIEAQAKITVGHEIGHGIIDYLINYFDGDNDTVNEFMQDYYNGEFDDERLAEEFGESMFPQATGVYSSELGDILSAL